MFVLFVLGGAIPSLLQFRAVKFLGMDPTRGLTQEESRQVFEQFLLKNSLYSPETAAHISHCPPLLFLLFYLTTVFAPFVVLLIGFDQISGDVQHRTLRYMAGRARREAIVGGKALGVWAVMGVMLLVLNITVWLLMLMTGASSAGAILTWGPVIWFFSLLSCAPFVGLICLISSFFRTPIVGLFLGMGLFFGLWVTNKALFLFDATRSATWALPFRYEDLVLSHDFKEVIGGAAGYLVWGVATSALAAFVVKKRDV